MASKLFLILLVIERILSSDVPLQCSAVCDCHQMLDELSVHCSHADLRAVPNFGSGRTNITNLELSGNYFAALEEDTFPLMPSLTRLVMTDAGIVTINLNAFVNLPNLVHLELERNPLHYLSRGMFIGVPKLRSLSVSYNALRTIGAGTFSGLRLDHLSLQNNGDLGYVALNAFENATLTLLNMDRCNLDGASLFAVRHLHGSLRTLYLSGNNKPLAIPASLLWNFSLEILHARNNQLRDLSFLDVAVVVDMLDVSHNPLVSVDIGLLPGLLDTRILIMNSCELLTLNNTANRQLHRLEELHLSNNRLTELNPRVFLRLRSLRKLDLRDNYLLLVTDAYFPLFDRLDDVSLQGNPLNCDCRMEWLRLLVLSKAGLNRGQAATCVFPADAATLSSPEPFKCQKPFRIKILVHPRGADTELKATPVAGAAATDLAIACSARGLPLPDLTITSASTSVGVDAPQILMRKCDGLAGQETASVCGSANISVDTCIVFYCGATNVLGTSHGHVSTCESNGTRGVGGIVRYNNTAVVNATVKHASAISRSEVALIAVACVAVALLLCAVVFMLTGCTGTGHVARPACLTPGFCSSRPNACLVEEEMMDSSSSTRLFVGDGDKSGEQEQKDVV